MTAGPFDPTLGSFPASRMRRNRTHDPVRRMVAENVLTPSDFIWPVFVVEGEGQRVPVPSMPGVERLSVDLMVGAAEEAFALGIPALAILRAGSHGALAGLLASVREPAHYFWAAGGLSSFLDNAPTYLTFFNSVLGRFYESLPEAQAGPINH